ncbi:ATP-binding cassette domain-containing protein [Jeotgalibaca porci]|uniref:ABC transporter ATP-binding protein n=1 Tax=Jeotgalibaca porci TaxID=1868793 RepID=UPI0035A17C86
MNSILEVKHLSFSVGEKEILKDISFKIQKGDFLTIKGPSGSGKSTLLKLLAAIMNPSTGEIIYKGKPLSEYEITDYRKEVSYSFQNAALFGTTVADNLMFPYEIRNEPFDRDRAIALLDKVMLSEQYLDQKITELSGGEKQRVALIRNVLFTPEVLLLDEVTSALDAENRKVISEAILRLNRENKITVLWVTHNTDEINDAAKTIEMKEGRLEDVSHD